VRIKERLILSVDIDEGVVRHSYSGGRLNLKRALSVWRDSVDFDAEGQSPISVAGAAAHPKPETTKGRLQTPYKFITVCGEQMRHRELLKLVRSEFPADPAKPAMWRGWRDAGGTRTKVEACEAKSGAVSGDDMHFDNGAAEPAVVPVARIRDYTARVNR
jgi:hypothetical protein